MWTFQGSPHFLGKQAKRFGAAPGQDHRSKNNEEIYRVATLMSQLSERQKRAMRDAHGKPIFPKPELDGIKGTLIAVEEFRTRLYMLAGATDAMLAEAYPHLGVAPPKRTFEIIADCDVATVPSPPPESFDDCNAPVE